MIEDEIKALRCAIEEVGGQYIEATKQFATAVNRLAEQVDALKAVERDGTDLPPAPQEKAKPAPAKKKKATKKKAAKKKDAGSDVPTSEAPVYMTKDVRAAITSVIQAHGMQQASQWLTEILGTGVHLDDIEDGDERLAELIKRCNAYLKEHDA